jgi:hypothetical protein
MTQLLPSIAAESHEHQSGGTFCLARRTAVIFRDIDRGSGRRCGQNTYERSQSALASKTHSPVIRRECLRHGPATREDQVVPRYVIKQINLATHTEAGAQSPYPLGK